MIDELVSVLVIFIANILVIEMLHIAIYLQIM